MRRTLLIGVVATAALSTVLATTATPASAGDPAWVQVADSSGHDDASLVAVDPGTGDVHVAGVAQNAVDNYDDLLLSSYPRSGSTLRTRVWDAPGATPSAEVPAGMAVDPTTGTLYVALTTYPEGANANGALLSFSRDGRLNWVRLLDRPEGDAIELSDLVIDPATGNVYLSGHASSLDEAAQAMTVGYDSQGRLLWQRTAGDGRSYAYAERVAVDPARGIVYTAGYTRGAVALWAYRTNGEPLWSATAEAAEADELPGMAVDRRSGTVFLQGTPAETGQGYFITAFSPKGGSLWRRVEGSGVGRGSGIDVDPRSGTVFVSRRVEAAAGNGDIETRSYAATTGALLWRQRYAGPNRAEDFGGVSTVDSKRGLLYVTGTSYEPGLVNGAATTVTYAVTGEQLRVDTYESGTGVRIVDAAVDPICGLLALTGTASSAVTDDDILTLAYPPPR